MLTELEVQAQNAGVLQNYRFTDELLCSITGLDLGSPTVPVSPELQMNRSRTIGIILPIVYTETKTKGISRAMAMLNAYYFTTNDHRPTQKAIAARYPSPNNPHKKLTIARVGQILDSTIEILREKSSPDQIKELESMMAFGANNPAHTVFGFGILGELYDAMENERVKKMFETPLNELISTPGTLTLMELIFNSTQHSDISFTDNDKEALQKLLEKVIYRSITEG